MLKIEIPVNRHDSLKQSIKQQQQPIIIFEKYFRINIFETQL